MRLYLVRHAIAGVRDPDRWPDDSERLLTKKGIRRFQKAARGLRSLVPAVDVVLSSPFVRAWSTALILEEDAGWPHPQVCEELTADAPIALLQALSPYTSSDSIALVGHEPYLSRFASILLATNAPSSFILMKKGGAAYIEKGDLGLLTSSAQLQWAMPPRVLRALG